MITLPKTRTTYPTASPRRSENSGPQTLLKKITDVVQSRLNWFKSAAKNAKWGAVASFVVALFVPPVLYVTLVLTSIWLTCQKICDYFKVKKPYEYYRRKFSC